MSNPTKPPTAADTTENFSLDGLNPKQQKAVFAILDGATYASAAKTAGISERQFYTWMRDEKFSSVIRAINRDAFAVAAAQLQQGAARAVLVLTSMMYDKEVPAPTRVTAAKTILELASKAFDTEQILERLAAVEKQLEAANKAERQTHDHNRTTAFPA